MRQFYYKMQQLLQNATFITDYLSTANNAKEVLDPVDKATFKYMICPSIFTIKNVLATTPFLFNKVSLFNSEKEFSNLIQKKSST